MPSNFGASSEKLSADNTGLTSSTSLPVRLGSRAVRAVLGCVSSGRQYNRCACRRRSYARAMPIGARLCSIFTSTAPSRSGDIHVCAIKGRTVGSLRGTGRRAVGVGRLAATGGGQRTAGGGGRWSGGGWRWATVDGGRWAAVDCSRWAVGGG